MEQEISDRNKEWEVHVKSHLEHCVQYSDAAYSNFEGTISSRLNNLYRFVLAY